MFEFDWLMFWSYHAFRNAREFEQSEHILPLSHVFTGLRVDVVVGSTLVLKRAVGTWNLCKCHLVNSTVFIVIKIHHYCVCLVAPITCLVDWFIVRWDYFEFQVQHHRLYDLVQVLFTLLIAWQRSILFDEDNKFSVRQRATFLGVCLNIVTQYL